MTAETCHSAPLVYAAHPVTTYGTDREQDALARIGYFAAPTQVIDPATRYRSTEDWLADWPELLSTLSGLIVFADADGTIGAGCLRELTDAWRLGIPAALLDDNGDLRHVSTLRIVPACHRTALRMAVVVGGRRFDLSSVLAPPRSAKPSKGNQP
jgi:hypothetical protein